MRSVSTIGKREGTAAVPDAHHIASIVHTRNGRLRPDRDMHIGVIHVVKDNTTTHRVSCSQAFNGFSAWEIHNHTLHFRPLAYC